MRQRRSSAHRLRTSVEAMPRPVREAMLRGIDSNEIIVGAYVDNSSGGICPMLAAHRCGERTSFGTFARAWDQFTRADPRKPRHATRREVRALRSYLERSLGGDDVAGRPLAEAVRSVQASRRRRAEIEAREGGAVTIEELASAADVEEQPREQPSLRIRRRPGSEREGDDRSLHPLASGR
ncbi:MAG: hypothetical protein ACXWD7_07345 [Solirubrobacterales bacterium]